MSKLVNPSNEMTIQDNSHTDFPDYNGYSPNILLGMIIKPHLSSEEIDQNKKKFKFKLSLKSLKSIKTSAIVSVRSLYQKLIISQKSLLKKYWDVVMELILGYNVITTLYFLAYEHPGPSMLIVDFFCWVLFVVDVGLNFFTEQMTDKGQPIRKFLQISKNYITGWLIPDVLAIIPFAAAGFPQAEYLLRMVRLIKLPGVLNITDGTGISFLLTYFQFGKREKTGKITYPFTTKIIASLIQLCITIIFLVYFLGCFWYWFLHHLKDYEYSDDQTATSPDESSFEEYFGLNELHSEHKALRSSYFILTTISTIGYGDFMARNVYEMGFVIVVMLTGVAVFAVIMGNFNSAFTFYTDVANGKDMLGELNTWMEMIERIHGNIPKLLRTKIIQHFSYYFERDRLKALAKNYWEAHGPDDLVSINQAYIKQLPEDTYYEVLSMIFEDFLSNISYYFPKNRFKFHILPHLQPRFYRTHKYIAKNNQPMEEIVFVLTGQVSIGVNIRKIHRTLLFCEEGRTILGDYSAITNTPNKFEYYVIKNADAYVINTETFMSILDTFYKSDKIHLLTIANERQTTLKRLLADLISKLKLAPEILDNLNKKYGDQRLKVHLKKKEIDDKKIKKDLENLDSISINLELKSKELLNIVNSTDKHKISLQAYLKRKL